MKRKTYGARGLIEWQIALQTGGVILRILFTGGSIGNYGVLPARYTTDNEVIQKLIEESPHFKSGRVYLIKEVSSGKGDKYDNDGTDITQTTGY